MTTVFSTLFCFTEMSAVQADEVVDAFPITQGSTDNPSVFCRKSRSLHFHPDFSYPGRNVLSPGPLWDQ